MVLGEGELNMAKYEEALKTFDQARVAFEKVGDVAGVANSLVRIGHAYRERGEYEETEKKYQEAEAIYRDNRLDWGVITCLRARGDLYKRQRKFDESRTQYEAALSLPERSRTPRLKRICC
jgi:two-component system sensor histidine kinase ChiS